MEDHLGYSLALLVDDEIKKEEGIELKVEPSRLQCHVCCKMLGHRSSLYKHLKHIHKIEPAHRLPISCREKGCYQSFTFIDPFRRHLAEHHGFNIVVEKYIFQSMKEFFCWKKMTEREEKLRFIVSTGPRTSKGGKTHYYRCQKNGTYKPEIKKRLQSDDRQSIYNISRTHCISSMCVFEESDCVTVEFCRTHYGHDVSSSNKKPDEDVYEGKEDLASLLNENNVTFETIDTCAKLNSLLSKKDREALTTILSENQHLLQETEELFYENEQDMMLKIPFNILRRILEDGVKDMDDSDTDLGMTAGAADGDLSDEVTIEKVVEGKTDCKDSTILKSLGNGIFLDPTSNKRLKLDSLKKKVRVNDTVNSPTGSPSQHERRRKDRDKNSTMLVKEYLNEFDEKVYVLEPMTEEDTVVQKREKILSQLQSILMMVNNEEDLEVLDDVERHLSKYAMPE
ncbi:UNVERIFIED_CONTAM: hypothetical protein PYX00_004778 [Menopon gallinae]|uniref:C2H2-type domain-containing protein n=1 Tax=Menopon gallinae TaxID=328185 RepID=A0AAW2I575_9NEOP